MSATDDVMGIIPGLMAVGIMANVAGKVIGPQKKMSAPKAKPFAIKHHKMKHLKIK